MPNRPADIQKSCDLPSVAFNFKCLQDSTVRSKSERSTGLPTSLKIQIISILRCLFDWRWDWERQYSGSADEIPVIASTSLADENGHPLHPTLILLPNRLCAIEIIYYNATLIYLFRIAKQLQWDFLAESTRAAPLVITEPLPASPLLLPSDIQSLEDVSSEFYRSVEGCLYGAEKSAGEWYQLMFSLFLVNAGLDEGSLEATWMSRIRGRIITTSGLDMWSSACKSI